MEYEHPASETRPFTAERLKVCPLCEALNDAESVECFACSWRGRFDTAPAQLEGGLARLLEECPDLADAVLSHATPPKRSRASRLKAFLRRLVWRLPS